MNTNITQTVVIKLILQINWIFRLESATPQKFYTLARNSEFHISDFANLSGKNSSPSVSEHRGKAPIIERSHTDNFFEKKAQRGCLLSFYTCVLLDYSRKYWI